MATTHERIVQAEEGIAQIQSALDHAQTALSVAEQVEVAATKSRKLLRFLLIACVVGILVVIIMKIASRRPEPPDLVLVDEPVTGAESNGDEQPPAS